MPDGNGHIPTPPADPPRPGDGDEDLTRQVLRYLNGELSADDVVQLGSRLRADAPARELFVRICLLESWLTEKFAPGRREFLAQMMLEDSEELGVAASFDAGAMPAILSTGRGAAGGDEDDEPEPLVVPTWPKPPAPATPWWRRKITWAAAASVVLVVGVWVTVHSLVQPEGPAVATLSGAQDVKWHNTSLTPVVGETLRASSELRLQSGLLRLTFNTGAKVVIEGPARFTPEADGRMRLSSGRLTALVPARAKGFTVNTPTAEVVDLGTEFGVDVPPVRGAAVEVQVFEGSVTLEPEPAQEQQRQAPAVPQLLRAGTAAKVDPAGTVTPVPANPAMFVRAAEADAIERASQGTNFDRWAAYRYQLARDPDVVAYYAFDADNKTKAPDRLVNGSSSGSALDGVLTGDGDAKPVWAEGRWPQKAALAFGGSGMPRVIFPAADSALDFSRGITPGEGQAFTIAVWIKAKPVPSPGVGIVSRGPKGVEQFAIETESTFYRFVLGDGVSSNPKNAVMNSRNYGSAYWHHVVTTYEPSSGAMRLYIDGAAVNDPTPGAGVAPRMPRPADGPVVLGCRLMSSGQYTMPLQGMVDELVFIRRAMTPGEVREMYEAGKPG